MTAAVPSDVGLFLDGYPRQGDNKTQSANLEFYTLRRRCRPDNLLIDEVHSKCVHGVHPPHRRDAEIGRRWAGDYRTLEYNHGFIQWLYVVLACYPALYESESSRFPIREQGMNYQAQPLWPHELEAMKADEAVVGRFIKSYELMLDFYGMRLLSRSSGLLVRATNFRSRYSNLSSRSTCPILPLRF